jgi:hypothetical protein
MKACCVCCTREISRSKECPMKRIQCIYGTITIKGVLGNKSTNIYVIRGRCLPQRSMINGFVVLV